MSFTPAIAEQRFVLDTVADIAGLAQNERFAAASPDLVDAILEGAGAFAAGVYAPLAEAGDRIGARWADGEVTMPDGFKAAYSQYVEAGWGAIDAPEDAGGQGLPFTLGMAVIEQLGTANTAFALCNVLTAGAIEALHAHGSDEQKRIYLTQLVTGAWSGTMNLTESQAGSDVGALKTMAEPAGDGSYRLRGTKIFISFGAHDLTDNIVHLVLARTPDAPAGTRGISLFLVPKFRADAEGRHCVPNDVNCVSIEHKLGIHASPTCVLSFGDQGDCHGWLIGEEYGGMRAMFTMMNNARLNVGHQGVQIAERATQKALAYARERIQSARAGGQSRASVAIIEHPDVRRMLLRARALTQAARALVYFAAGNVDRARLGDGAARARVEVLTPLVKTYGTDIANEVAALGVQVHGGMGFIEETGAACYVRDARITTIYEGTNGIQAADLVGRKLTLEGGAPVRALLAEVAAEAEHSEHAALKALASEVSSLVDWMVSQASLDDRLAGSYPLTTMFAVAVAAMLMARQGRIAAERLASGEGEAEFLKMKQVVAAFYLDRIVPEALGLAAAARAGADGLYALSAEALSA